MTFLAWLDFRYVWGQTSDFCLRLAAFTLLVGIVVEIVSAQRSSVLRVQNMTHESVSKLDEVGIENFLLVRGKYKAKESLKQAAWCLTQAIYFEARSEPIEGWEAVADVVINRVRDRRYPATVCGVVFQGRFQRHKCQFSFACDGRPDRARPNGLWRKAMRVAVAKLTDSKALPKTAHATHYHADYVDPYWNKKMVRLAKIGRHIFYSTRAQVAKQ